MLPKAVLALLRKFSKGLKGTFDAGAVDATFKLFGPAWTVTEVLAPLPITSSEDTSSLFKAWLNKHNARAWGYDGVKEPKEFWFESRAVAETALAEFKNLVRGSGPKGPSSVTLGEVYVAKIGDVRIDRERWIFDITGIWTGVRALTFKMPKGEMTLPFKHHTDASELTSDRFWKLAYLSGAKELSLETLGSMDRVEVEKVLAPSKIRDLGNTGTCPVCFNNVKLTAKSHVSGMPGMVLHGYRRPGHGSVEGNCFGQDWPPFELSPKGTEAYIKYLSTHVKALEEQLRSLDRAVTLPDPYQSIRNKTIEKDKVDPSLWQLALEKTEASIKRRIDWVGVDIDRLERAASTWKATPLPTGLRVAMRFLAQSGSSQR